MYKFSDDYNYLYIKNPDGSVAGIPTKLLTEEDKQYVYEQIAKQGY